MGLGELPVTGGGRPNAGIAGRSVFKWGLYEPKKLAAVFEKRASVVVVGHGHREAFEDAAGLRKSEAAGGVGSVRPEFGKAVFRQRKRSRKRCRERPEIQSRTAMAGNRPNAGTVEGSA